MVQFNPRIFSAVVDHAADDEVDAHYHSPQVLRVGHHLPDEVPAVGAPRSSIRQAAHLHWWARHQGQCDGLPLLPRDLQQTEHLLISLKSDQLYCKVCYC